MKAPVWSRNVDQSWSSQSGYGTNLSGLDWSAASTSAPASGAPSGVTTLPETATAAWSETSTRAAAPARTSTFPLQPPSPANSTEISTSPGCTPEKRNVPSAVERVCTRRELWMTMPPSG